MQKRQPMNIAVTGSIAAGTRLGVLPSTSTWCPTGSSCSTHGSAITKDFLEMYIAESESESWTITSLASPSASSNVCRSMAGSSSYNNNSEQLEQLCGQRNSRSRRSKPRRAQASWGSISSGSPTSPELRARGSSALGRGDAYGMSATSNLRT